MSTLIEVHDALMAADPANAALYKAARGLMAECSMLENLSALRNEIETWANKAHTLFTSDDPAALTVASAGLLGARDTLSLLIENLKDQEKPSGVTCE